jgi:hypothetical protein
MLNKLAQLLSEAAFVGYDTLHGRQMSKERQQLLGRARFMLAIWVLYLAGAVMGTWLDVDLEGPLPAAARMPGRDRHHRGPNHTAFHRRRA